jgi:hypothetical protein
MPLRVTVASLAGVCAAVLLAACSGSSGTHTQSLSPSSSVPMSSGGSSGGPSSTSSSAPALPKSGQAPTPTVTPAAQGAVDAYIADFNAGIAASRNPSTADLSWITKYETGKFASQTRQSFEYMKTHHEAYRGAAPRPSVKVGSVLSPKAVILTSCLLTDSASPWTQYDTTTGKPIPRGKPRNPPPPYLLRVFMRARSGTNWQISSIEQDTSKTCTG